MLMSAFQVNRFDVARCLDVCVSTCVLGACVAVLIFLMDGKRQMNDRQLSLGSLLLGVFLRCVTGLRGPELKTAPVGFRNFETG